MSAKEALAKLEEALGLHVSHHMPDGKIEKGHGSLYQQLKPEDRQKHDEHQAWVEAEDELAKHEAEGAALNERYSAAKAKVDGYAAKHAPKREHHTRHHQQN